MATIHQADHMNSIGTALDENPIQIVVANHAGRLKVAGAEGLVVPVRFFVEVVVAEFGSVSFWYVDGVFCNTAS
jgi:hypothetical protein